jgi:hypothetical protein
MLANEIAAEWQERVQLAEGKRMSRNALETHWMHLLNKNKKSTNLPDLKLKSPLSSKEL